MGSYYPSHICPTLFIDCVSRFEKSICRTCYREFIGSNTHGSGGILNRPSLLSGLAGGGRRVVDSRSRQACPEEKTNFRLTTRCLQGAPAARSHPKGSLRESTLRQRVGAFRARLWLAQGNYPAADRWAADSPVSADDEPTTAYEIEHTTLARILIANRHLARRRTCLKGCTRLLWSAGLPAAA